jgi:hypothetical protein
METLKGIGGCLLALVGFAAMLVLVVLFFMGAGWVSAHLLPWALIICVLVTAILFIILLPLSAIKNARGFTAMTILIFSYVFGISAWMYGLLVTLSTWGVVAVIIGLCFGGVGVVPIGILAALFHGEWEAAFELIILIALTFGCRAFAIWLDVKNQERRTYQPLLEDETSFEDEPRICSATFG